jgi:hypothetical protein
VPTKGEDVIVTLGSVNNLTRLFAGNILEVEKVLIEHTDQYVYRIAAIDYTWLGDRRIVRKRYTNQSATAIAQDLVSTFTSGFTSVNVAASLATVDEITFTDETVSGALTRLAKRIGGYWYWDYQKDLHFFLSESTNNPNDLTTSLASLTAFNHTDDLSQIITRVFVEGYGSTALGDVAVGETALPVETVDYFNAGGGTVVSGPQQIAYTGLQVGGGGSLVGPGAGPSVAPNVALVEGAGVTSGVQKYAFTFVTGAGESLPGPLATLTVGASVRTVDPPSSAPSAAENAGGPI